MQDKLITLLEPLVEDLGYELIWVQLAGGEGSQIVRVFIDHADGIDVDDCAKVSREVSGVMDVEDPIPGNYTLEVSSPGLDRPLVKRAHFEQFAGAQVKLRTYAPSLEGRRRYTGMLKGVAGDEVEIEVDGELHAVPLDNIEIARLVPEV
ncbi:ribosome maturation factor RimP [bacterium]|nr:ribosome maturation factor RimP [bacterium]